MVTAPAIRTYDLASARRTLAVGGMEMRDLSTIHSLNGDPGNEMTTHADRSSLEPSDDTALALLPEMTDHRTELYARLRTIIDSATESIRALKEENATLSTQKATMTERIGTLEGHIRTVTTALADDELALRKSAEGLEQALQGIQTAPVADREPAAPADPEMHAAVDSAPTAESSAPQPTMAETEQQTEAETDAENESEPEMAMATETAAETETEMGPEPEAAMPVMEQAVASATDEGEPAPQAEEQAAVATDEHEHERVIAPPPASTQDGTYTLVAYPFVRFSDLGQFQAALQKLTGVHDVQVRRFAQGTLEMRLGYGGPTDLATTLRTLAAEIEDVQEEEPYRLRVRLRTSQAA